MAYTSQPSKTYAAAAVLDDYTLVRLDASGNLVANDASHAPLGAIDVPALEAGQPMNVILLNKQGTIEIQAVGAVAVGDLLVAAADGKVIEDPGTGTRYVVGMALSAVSAGGVVEVLPYGYGHTLTA